MDNDAIYETIEDILDEFDFMRVHAHMKHAKWEWLVPDGGLQVPTMQMLRRTARRLLLSVAHKATDNGYMSSTGGFEAEGFKIEDSDVPYLTLKFVLTQWSNEHVLS